MVSGASAMLVDGAELCEHAAIMSTATMIECFSMQLRYLILLSDRDAIVVDFNPRKLGYG